LREINSFARQTDYGNSSIRAITRKLTFRVIIAAIAADLGDEA
jgi:hypothetical protein